MTTATTTKAATGTTKTTGRRGNPNFGKRQRTATAAVKTVKQRTRRSAIELIQAKQEKLARAEERVEKLKQEIATLEGRHSKSIEVDRLLQEHTPEELANMIEDLKKKQKVVRKAVKKAGASA